MKEKLENLIKKIIQALYQLERVNFSVDYPKVDEFGDYSTNVAMVLAKELKKNPMDIAEAIKNAVADKRFDLEESKRGSEVEPRNAFEKIEVAALGYINFHLAPEYLQGKVAEILEQKEKFGNSEIGKGVKINNEFISANPTGPLHLGNGRGGFYGDSIGRVCRKAGFEVTNEYYVNDAGEQTLKLAHSFKKDDQTVYTGEYIDELREKHKEILEMEVAPSAAPLADAILAEYINPAVEKMKVEFDEWFSEKSLYDGGYVDNAIERLKKDRGYGKLAYEKDGALWLRTTIFGDDKDRVLIKGDGQKTYFASDCGYILNKMERGFDKFIEIWGADHHGYINRFKAAAKALGFEGELKFIIVQLVRLVKDGKEVRMSKRAGNVVYIDELIEKVGHDVARFFFLQYSPDTHMNFDLGLAQERSQKNPVFYVQYAHARICSILRKYQELQGDSVSLPAGRQVSNQNDQKTPSLESLANLKLLVHDKELSLIRELNRFPELVEELAQSYAVHKLPHYAIKLADKFHSFYQELKVIDAANPELARARLNLINAVRIVLAETLRLIGVSAPEKM